MIRQFSSVYYIIRFSSGFLKDFCLFSSVFSEWKTQNNSQKKKIIIVLIPFESVCSSPPRYFALLTSLSSLSPSFSILTLICNAAGLLLLPFIPSSTPQLLLCQKPNNNNILDIWVITLRSYSFFNQSWCKIARQSAKQWFWQCSVLSKNSMTGRTHCQQWWTMTQRRQQQFLNTHWLWKRQSLWLNDRSKKLGETF